MTGPASGSTTNITLATGFTVSSADIEDGRIAEAQYADGPGYHGKNISPALEWTNAPEGTRSFVVSMYDQDASTGSGFWHWVIIDIPATATGLASGAGNDLTLLPSGALNIFNDASIGGYVGIAPPLAEIHNYIITVKALSVEKLPILPNATAAMVGFVSNMHVLATSTIMAKGGN